MKIKITKTDDEKIRNVLNGKHYIMVKQGDEYDITMLDSVVDSAKLLDDLSKAMPGYKVKEKEK